MSTITGMSAASRAALMAILRTATLRTQLVRTADQSIPNATTTIISWQAAEINELAGVWSSVTNPDRITVPTGFSKVKISASHSYENVDNQRRILRLVKNNTTMICGDYRVARNESQGHLHSRWLDVVAGDYFYLDVYQDAGSARNLIGGNGYAPVWALAEWRV